MISQGFLHLGYFWASPVAQQERIHLPMQETLEMQVRSLSGEDPKKEMAIHSSILAWRILQTEEPGGLQSMLLQRVEKAERPSTHRVTHATHL